MVLAGWVSGGLRMVILLLGSSVDALIGSCGAAAALRSYQRPSTVLVLAIEAFLMTLTAIGQSSYTYEYYDLPPGVANYASDI